MPAHAWRMRTRDPRGSRGNAIMNVQLVESRWLRSLARASAVQVLLCGSLLSRLLLQAYALATQVASPPVFSRLAFAPMDSCPTPNRMRAAAEECSPSRARAGKALVRAAGAGGGAIARRARAPGAELPPGSESSNGPLCRAAA
jgi:hypothetical protein